MAHIKVNVPPNVFNHYFQQLCKSLHMHYTKRESGPIQKGDHVVAHPQFDPKIVENMDRNIPKVWADIIYKRAFEKCKIDADRMLKHFEMQQQAINRRHYYNALYRLNLFAPEAARAIDKRRIKGPAELLKFSRNRAVGHSDIM